MGLLEARFSLAGMGYELLFTIIEDEYGMPVLYSANDNMEYKYPLVNNEGLLRLRDGNPFEESDDIIDERLTGLSSDWIESKAQGFDNAVAFSPVTRQVYGPDDIFVENKPFSLRQILDLIEMGDIELTPDFQRNFIWDKTRQSKLIESILLGLPLPSIYLSQYEDGRLTVVDGLQRLSTIKAFLNNDLKLSNLEYLEECNGLYYNQLEQFLSPLRLRRFTQTQIMCFVIDYRSPSKLKFDLFRRLNTGGKPLNNQEIRNCLSRPEVQQVLKAMVALESFSDATDRSVKDARMDAREAALRFLYFNSQYTIDNPVGEYNGDMEGTLDDLIDVLNRRSLTELEREVEVYDRGLKNAYYLFGRYCFRKVTTNTLYERRAPVNKLLMLTFSLLLSKYNHSAITGRLERESLLPQLADFIEHNEEVFRAITWGTNGSWNLNVCLNAFRNFLENYVGHADYTI